MTTFKEIRGTDILALSSDPSNPELGQIWYNSSSGTLKGYKAVNTWSAGGNMNTPRRGPYATGTQTASLAAGGFQPPFTFLSATELYNGTAWTTNPASLGSGRYTGGSSSSAAGDQTASVIFGGYRAPPTATWNTAEKWNGTSWTSTGSMNTARYGISGFGTQTAALGAGGYVAVGPPYNVLASTESFNGSTWTSVNSMNTARNVSGRAGTQTAALIFSGTTYPGPLVANTESWNGTSWTSVNSLNTARQQLGGAGTQILALAYGGLTPASTGATELYNGTSWTTSPSTMGTARDNFGSVGTQTAAIAFAGNPGPGGITTATELWTGLKIQTRTVS